MKNLFLIPALALIFAVGISSANVEEVSDPSTDYIYENGSFVAIGMELDCGAGNETCQVQFEENGPIHDVYDAESLSTLKKGIGVKRLWQ